MLKNETKVVRLNEREQKIIEILRTISNEDLLAGLRGLNSGSSLAIKRLISTIEDHFDFTSIQGLRDLGFITQQQINELLQAIENNENIIISGSTGTGKTVLFNVLLRHILTTQLRSKIVFFEQYKESKLNLESFGLEYMYQEGGSLNMEHISFLSQSESTRWLAFSEARLDVDILGISSALNAGSSVMLTIHGNSLEQTKNRLLDKNGEFVFLNKPYICVNVKIDENKRYVESINRIHD
jgi:type IV secretory pathway ATPase VirB11/archaellum biosynthesis ATPase